MGEGDKEGLRFCGWGEDTGELGALLFLGARAIAFFFPEGHRKRWWKGMFLGRCGSSREISVDVHPDLKARGPFQVSHPAPPPLYSLYSWERRMLWVATG